MVLLYKDVRNTNTSISGLNTIDKLQNLIIDVQLYRGLTYLQRNNKKPNRAIEVRRSRLKVKINAELENLSGMPWIKDGPSIKDHLKQINVTQEELQRKNSLSALEEFNVYSKWISGLHSAVKIVSDRSRLSFDREIDTFYLSKVFIFSGPEVMESLGRVRGISSGYLASGNKSGLISRKLEALIGRLDISAEQLSYDLLTVTQQLPSFKDLLENTKRIQSEVDSYRTLAVALSRGADSMQLRPLEYFDSGAKVVESVNSLVHDYLGHLKTRLVERESEGRLTLILVTVATISGIGLMIFFMNSFYRSNVHSFANVVRYSEQLRQAQKMEAIGHLAGGIAHDFNNILASTLGFVYLAKTQAQVYHDEDLNESLEEITIASDRARDLVKQMLTFSRVDKADPDVRAVNIYQSVEEIVKLLRPTLASNLNIKLVAKDESLTAKIDPVQLHQTVMNLCINSHDAMNGRGDIIIKMGMIKANKAECSSCHKIISGDFVEIMVKDTGDGIPNEHLNSIFEPFYTTKAVGKGSGMGLSVVHGIAHRYDGHVLVESKPGSSTAISLLLPAVAGKTSQDKSSARTDSGKVEPSRIKPGPGQRSNRIMVVDDEAAVARVVTKMLEQCGYEVKSYSSPEQALDELVNGGNTYDALVTDLVMPNITGVQFARKIRDHDPQLPIILCSGNRESGQLEASDRFLFTKILDKPIDPSMLVSAIANSHNK